MRRARRVIPTLVAPAENGVLAGRDNAGSKEEGAPHHARGEAIRWDSLPINDVAHFEC